MTSRKKKKETKERWGAGETKIKRDKTGPFGRK